MRKTKDFNNAIIYMIGSGILWVIGAIGSAAGIAAILSITGLSFLKVFWLTLGLTVLATIFVFFILFTIGGILGRSSMITIKTFKCIHCGTLDAANTVLGANIKCSFCGKFQKPIQQTYIKGDINDRRNDTE